MSQVLLLTFIFVPIVLLDLKLAIIYTKYFFLFYASTHLYGRRLVLEWAEEEETVEDLRRKTAHSFVGNSENSQNGPPAKRAKTKSAIAETLQTL